MSGKTADELRNNGVAATQRGDPDGAEAAYLELLELDPNDIYGLVGLGSIARLRGRREEALQRFAAAAAVWPRHPWPLLELGGELDAAGQSDEAEATFRRALELSPGYYHVLMALGRLLARRGDHAGAANMFRSAADAHPADAAPHVALAEELARLGRHDEAGVAYRSIVDNPRAQTARRRDAALAGGWLARDQLHDRALALDFFERAVALDPNHAQARRELANAYWLANRLDDAESVYGELLQREPENVFALNGLAMLRRLADRPDEALPLIEKACANDPNQEENRLELGYVLRDLGRADDAYAVLESIEPSSPVFASASAALGHLARARGDHEGSAKHFEQAAKGAADPTDALYHLAGAKRLMGDLLGARDVIERMLARDPPSYRAHLADGILKRETNDRRGARAAFLRAAELAPMEAQPRIEIATEHIAFGELPHAAAALEVALQIDPGHEEARLRKASILAESDEAEAALEILAHLRAQCPASVWSYLSAAQILANSGRFAAALEILAAAQKTCRPNWQIEFRMATVLRQQGLLDESYRQFAATHDCFPREFWPWHGRTLAAVELGHFDAAEALLTAAPATTVAERTYVAKLRAQLDKARWALEAAIDELGVAIDLDPHDAGAAEERAKLKLMTLDLSGAWADLTMQAKAQSARAKREKNPLHSLVGQLYEEFALDRILAAELASTRGLAPQDSLARLAELVRSYPDSTAPSIGLMIALRRSGQFDLAQDRAPDPAPRIPRLITQYWDEREPPPDVAGLMDSWSGCDPGFRIERFDDASALAYLRERCAPAVAHAFDQIAEPAQRADLFRLARLFVAGGYFIDADDRARGGLTAHVPGHAEFFAHQEDLGSIGNNVLGATPRHPAVGLALNDAVAAILRGDRDIVWLTTGPGLLTRSLARWLAAEPLRLGDRVASMAILTPAQMRQVAAMHCNAAYKSTGRAWLSGAFRKTQAVKRRR